MITHHLASTVNWFTQGSESNSSILQFKIYLWLTMDKFVYLIQRHTEAKSLLTQFDQITIGYYYRQPPKRSLWLMFNRTGFFFHFVKCRYHLLWFWQSLSDRSYNRKKIVFQNPFPLLTKLLETRIANANLPKTNYIQTKHYLWSQ